MPFIRVNQYRRNASSPECDLRLMSVDTADGLVNEGRNLVIVALVGTNLHIRIFDANGKRVVDKAENRLISGETLTTLKKQLNPLPDEAGLSQEQKQKIIRDATSIAGHTRSPLTILRQTWRLKKASNLNGITIVSAFTDPVIIGQVLDELNTEGPEKKIVKVCLDFGASGYHRDEEVTGQLDALAARLTKGFHENSGIFLIKLGRFLHSKVLVLHTKNGDRVSIGSLNFTRRAFFTNEEVLTNITDVDDVASVQKYIADLFGSERCRKVPFERALPNEAVNSCRKWLLRGALFFEDRVTSPYNFKLGLPQELLRQPALIIPDAKAEVPDNISLMQLLGIPDTKLSLAWKRYCVPTCYGHWCPSQLATLARDSIQEAIAKKQKAKIEPVLQNEGTLTKKFYTLFNEIEKNINKFNRTNNTRYVWSKKQTITRLEKWIPRIVKKLKDKDNLYQLLAGVNETIVPDFWAGDEIALREFEESFCSHIVLELSKSRVQNWAVLWLRDIFFKFESHQSLGIGWDDSWDNEEVWLEWLRRQASDPFEELPNIWRERLSAR